ncbi:DNA starvation/stationary phase protection protein [Paenibacillus sp. YYML68]|uniref:Dps family protein n=1 Tax=Paenibacillus sp. YYML68 TaxID=2909250 RepID=UPI00249004C3|nr:Dps family protein [Paenibacillus sp. YYML68]
MATVLDKERTGTQAQVSGNLLTLLNQQVANWAFLHIKLHQHHWFVKGPQFITLHEKFEELYTAAAQTLDELAERLLALNGKPVSTLKEITELATIKEHAPLTSAEAMIKSVRDDFKQLISELEQTMQAAEGASDEGTHDMLNGIRTELQKQVWMLDSCLQS